MALFRLGCLGNFSGFQAARADADPANRCADQGANTLKIRLESTLGPVVCMADPIAKLGTFATYFTSLRHCANLLHSSDGFVRRIRQITKPEFIADAHALSQTVYRCFLP